MTAERPRLRAVAGTFDEHPKTFAMKFETALVRASRLNKRAQFSSFG
jgi:hypothetical protein